MMLINLFTKHFYWVLGGFFTFIFTGLFLGL
jgi:hypothetical protein